MKMRSTTSPASRLAAAALAAAAITSGCSAASSGIILDPVRTSEPTPVAVAESEPATPEPTPSVDPETAALDVYRNYRMLVEVAAHARTVKGTGLDKVTSTAWLRTMADAAETLRLSKHHRSGAPKLSPVVTSVAPLVVKIKDCFDTTDVTIVDDDGSNVKTGPDRVPSTATVVRASASAPWLVTKVTHDFTGTKC